MAKKAAKKRNPQDDTRSIAARARENAIARAMQRVGKRFDALEARVAELERLVAKGA